MPSSYFARYGSDQYVLSANGASHIYFDTNYGGAVLSWLYPINATPKEITDPNAGTAFQFVVDQGQDVTQGGCNGVTEFQIARTGVDTGAALAYKNYYARESEDGFPTGNISQDIYVVTGFFPDFWASLEAIDDAIPPVNSSLGGGPQTQWVTGYTPTFGSSPPIPYITTSPFNITTFGTPVYFSAYEPGSSPPHTLTSSGILMEGNEQKPVSGVNWNDRLREIPEGRVAFRVKVSLSNASDDSWAGVLFRKNVPGGSGKNMDDAYTARGYSLNVNRNGDIQLVYFDGNGNSTAFWTYSGTTTTQTSVRNAFGIKLEVRTFNFSYDPWLIEVWADEVKLTSDSYRIPDDFGPGHVNCRYSDGKNVGLIAYTTNSQQRVSGQPNFVRFADREIFNIGTQTTTTYAPNTNGSITVTTVHGPAPGLSGTVSLYTMTQVGYLSSDSDFGWALTENPLGTFNNGPDVHAVTYHDTIAGAPSPQIALLFGGAYNPSISRSSNIGLGCKTFSVSFGSVPTPYTYAPHGQVQSRAASGSTNLTNLGINALEYISGPGAAGPWDLGTVTLTATWYPFLSD